MTIRHFPLDGLPDPTLLMFSDETPWRYRVTLSDVEYTDPDGSTRAVAYVTVTVGADRFDIEVMNHADEVVAEGAGPGVAEAWAEAYLNGPAIMTVIEAPAAWR